MSPCIRVKLKIHEPVFCGLRRTFLTQMCHQNAFLPQIAKIRQKALDTPYKREEKR